MNKKLYVGNLPYSTTDSELRALFESAGEVADVTIIIDKETGRSRGFGFVEMTNDDGAQEAIRKYNGFQMGSRPLTVNEARPREERPRFDRGDRGDRGGGRGDRGGDRW